MADPRRSSARLQLIMVAGAFMLPLVVAALLYFGGYAPSKNGGTQHGVLLEPILHIPDVLDEPDVVQIAAQRWILVYANDAACERDCEEALYRLRQVRLMLGNDMTRLQRLFLHGDPAPDRVFIEQQHSGLESLKDERLGNLLDERRPQAEAAGGFFLIDPFGNLVMYFPPALNPGDLVEDLEHLLDLSRIG